MALASIEMSKEPPTATEEPESKPEEAELILDNNKPDGVPRRYLRQALLGQVRVIIARTFVTTRARSQRCMR